MADKFVMSSRQSAELDHAFERNGWSSEDVKWLSTGTNLASFLDVRRGMAKVVPTSLLEFVATTTVAATTTPFVARDRFVLNTGKNAPVKISYLGDNFKGWFLDKKEEPFAGSTLRSAKLIRSSVDGPIIETLGGEDKAETALTEVSALMEAQKKGEDGILLTNGYANIFYVRDASNVLRAVYVDWSDVGWYVGAFEVSLPVTWRGGGRVFSRNS